MEKYTSLGVGTLLDISLIKTAIKGCVFGRVIKSYCEISSTQDYAISFAEINPNSHGTVIVSESQTNGRGRGGNSWKSPRGGLWFSIITKPEIKASSSIILSFAISLAICETMVTNFGIPGYIKWPNDILIKGKKAGGIILSTAVQAGELEYAIVGIGLNLNAKPKEISTSTSCVEHSTNPSISSELFLAAVLRLFSRYYELIECDLHKQIIDQWKKLCPMIGHKISVSLKGVQIDGVAHDIDLDGSLILMTPTGKILKISDSDASVRKYESHL
jgi:BirA family biotin operon repressor/biotin-[acetyl-CoA-carboxylase] ligase